MFYKNDAGKNVIQFGTGSVEVGNGRVLSNDKKEMYPCVVFIPQNPPGEIGKFCHPDKLDDPAENRDDAHTTLVFTDIRSFDVVINHLQDAKERFKKNGCAVLGLQEITDEVTGRETT
jgi:hypothetical protein